MPFKGGGYPWNIAGDNRAVLHIKNIDAPNDGVRRQAMAKLYFDGGEYNLPLQQMDAGQTVEIDLKKLRDDQVRDVLGNVIPLNVTGGQLDWSGRAGKGEFIGRLAEYDPISGVASSFSCVGACPCDTGFGSAVIYPGGISGFVGDIFNFSSTETDTDCNQQVVYTYNVGANQGLQYSSSDESVMTVSGNIATLVGAGTAEITASWEAFTVETHCFLSAEGDCVDARCNSRPVSNPIVDSTGQVACTKPTGETTVAVGWVADSGSRTILAFTQTLSPSTTSFSGRSVKESLGGQVNDTCWFIGSGESPAAITGSTWTVASDNTWGYDLVGYDEHAVNTYRQAGVVPCGYTISQRMDIYCNVSLLNYKFNTLGAQITATTVSSTRDGHTVTKTWP